MIAGQSVLTAETAANATATATLWTPTITPDVFASADALETQRAVTATAESWTNTPTITPTFTPLELAMVAALVGVTGNDDWTPFEQEVDGVPMVLVPKGCYMMGSNAGEADEQPVVQQCIDQPFWLDKYEVSNGQFAAFNGVAGRDSNWTGDDLPRESITWVEARDFCESRGGRLPTELEWEFAARGPDGLVYPWGNEFVADNVVYRSNAGDKTAPVGSRPGGISWVGALDLSGNVYEWVSSLYLPYPYDSAQAEDIEDTNSMRGLRGGSWYGPESLVRAAFRNSWNPVIEFFNLGFRCARSG